MSGTTDELYAPIELLPQHWMLKERQLVNWGSYDGRHIFRPSMAEDGTVTLLTGQSESGKSTLVDAQVSLLYPANAAFNKASNAGRSDRSDYSYLLGLRGIRNNNGHDEPLYLRGHDANGDPYAVWGAIVDEYEDTANSGSLWIAKLMWLPADGASESMTKLYAVSEHPIDPVLLDARRDEKFTIPLLKQLYPGVVAYNSAKQFHEDVWKRFGLTEAACRLLHRMQASDAPSQLDDIFRKGVLDEPRAIRSGRDAVEDYEQYAQNFSSMERNRARVRQLEAIIDEYGQYESADSGVRALRAIDPERDAAAELRAQWLDMRLTQDVVNVLPEHERLAERSAEAADGTHARVARLEGEVASLTRQLSGSGGDEIEGLEHDLAQAKRDLGQVAERAEKLAPYFTKAGEDLPGTREEWQRLADDYAAREREYDARRETLKGRQYEAFTAHKQAQERLDELNRDYARKERSRTRITKEMDETRAMIARATGLQAAELPYVAELMDVADDAEDWRAAMNVVYAPIAPILLVDRRHEDGFAAKVSTIPREAMPRRNWQFVDVDDAADAAPRSGWLSGRLMFNDESPFAAWVRRRVCEPRTDARCVEAIDDLDEDGRQVQRDGQIKDGRRGSHGTKGMTQVIGFVTEGYLAELRREIGQAGDALAHAQARVKELDAESRRLEDAHALAERLHDYSWQDVDANGVQLRIEALLARIDELKHDPQIAQISAALEAAQKELAKARAAAYGAEDDQRRAQAALAASRKWIADREQQIRDGAPAVDEACATLLERCYLAYFGDGTKEAGERVRRLLALDDQANGSHGGHARANATSARRFVELKASITDGVRARIGELAAQREARRRSCEASMRTYLDQYASGDARISADVENAKYFMHDFEELRPNMIGDEAVHVEYFNSLNKIYQDLAELQQMLKVDTQRIREQIDKINRLLERYPFGARHGRLSIVVQVDGPDPAFLAALGRQVEQMSAFREGGSRDVDRCRTLFARCAPFIAQLKESFDDSAGNGHGNANLDPRRRSRFYGSVAHADGLTERINSTGGGSGGYLQELTSFAYGAALMYLLANDNATRPSYATVFLDEALIKADGQYTRRALSVLPGLGFQVIVSAPESKTNEIMGSASKTVIARKDPDSGRTVLEIALIDGDGKTMDGVGGGEAADVSEAGAHDGDDKDDA